MNDSDRHHTYPQPGTWTLAFANLLFLAACGLIVMGFWYGLGLVGNVLLEGLRDLANLIGAAGG